MPIELQKGYVEFHFDTFVAFYHIDQSYIH
jgi:hypothetical protein